MTRLNTDTIVEEWEKDIREWNCKHTPGEEGSGCQCQIRYIRALISQAKKDTTKEILTWLDNKEIGKGERECFDDGAYEENREIRKFIKLLNIKNK